MIARCSFCHWRFRGESSEALVAQHAHVRAEHPEVLLRAEARLTPHQRDAKKKRKHQDVLRAERDDQQLERERTRETERDAKAEKIVAMARANPDWTIGQLQREVGYGTVFIRAVLEEAGLPVLHATSR